MNLTKNIISREEALKISPDYLPFVEGDFSKWKIIDEKFEKLKRGQAVLTYSDKQFVLAKVSSINNTFQAIDGPVVRVSNGEYSWRCDGDHYAWPTD